MAGRLDPIVQQLLHPFPDTVAPWPDDHTTTNAAFLGHVGFADDGLIPGGEILFAGNGKGVLHGSGLVLRLKGWRAIGEARRPVDPERAGSAQLVDLGIEGGKLRLQIRDLVVLAAFGGRLRRRRCARHSRHGRHSRHVAEGIRRGF